MPVSRPVAVVPEAESRAARIVGRPWLELVRRAGDAALGNTGSPYRPAAVRVERSHVDQGGARGDQTALTVWFGRGPSLPGPSLPAMSGPSVRFAARAAAAAVGAAALGAMAVIASRREAERQPARRLLGPGALRGLLAEPGQHE